jgi:hypothetical protein
MKLTGAAQLVHRGRRGSAKRAGPSCRKSLKVDGIIVE